MVEYTLKNPFSVRYLSNKVFWFNFLSILCIKRETSGEILV